MRLLDLVKGTTKKQRQDGSTTASSPATAALCRSSSTTLLSSSNAEYTLSEPHHFTIASAITPNNTSTAVYATPKQATEALSQPDYKSKPGLKPTPSTSPATEFYVVCPISLWDESERISACLPSLSKCTTSSRRLRSAFGTYTNAFLLDTLWQWQWQYSNHEYPHISTTTE